MNDVWVLGTAAWDVVYKCDHLPAAGTLSSARSMGRRPGGSSGNIARGLASAGHTVHLVAQVGTEELGDALIAELASCGVDTGHMLRCRGCTPETLIFIDRAGERTILVIDKDFTKTVPVPYDTIADADAVFVGCFADYGPQLPDVLRQTRALVVTQVPPPGSGADWCADIVVGSATDFTSAWLKAPYQTLRQHIGDRLRWVVVTQGELGALAFGPNEMITIPAVETVVVDTTGAGDAFVAGMMHGLLQDKDIATAGALGAHWAAAAVKFPQSVPPRWTQLQLGESNSDWWVRLAPRRGPHSGPVA